MTAKDKTRQMKSMMAYADAEDHQRLRKLLADRAQTYGHLRRDHDLSPIFWKPRSIATRKYSRPGLS